MKLLRTIIFPALLAGLGFLATGCDSVREDTFTGRLWTDWSDNHYQPAPRPDVKMYQAPYGEDTLVVYLEQREKTGRTHRRAYYMLANDHRVEDQRKPRFVSVHERHRLVEIPVEFSGHINLNAPIWAELTPDQEGFRLFRNGAPTDWYHLPVYLDRPSETERILLTPVAFTEDTAVVVGVVGVVGGLVYLESRDDSGCSHDWAPRRHH